jgi:dihydrofolate reductase
MTISCIAAMSENGVIGRDNGIPWRLPSDLAHFKRTTIDHTIVMGRKTWESIGSKPLPRRRHVVITRREGYAVPPGVEVVASWEQAMERVRDDGEVFVVGGESVYANALPVAARVYLTVVHAEIEGDVRFPDRELADFRLVSEERHEADDANPYAHTFRVYERS